MAFEELFDAFDDVGRVVSACRRVHVRDIIKRSKQMWSDRGNAERERERERGLSRERDVPAALKISHDVQKRLVHVALVAREPQFNRSHVDQRIVGGLRVLLRGGLRGVHLANARPEASSAFRLKI